ncbi:alpha/beta hydrolase [Streptomyces sp. Je 1-369]|uniref:alpha/beta hydrolase n=1 Tax=Streptomyces sp. Je 1-369 TaxID=2966192 RepID=UPI002285E802|nr:alpha/beta hydrolase [Streptomyces sp. Je 1-369]WAL93217.1 alpha/beta hydrolase [Streptomyces sp. Je 1-369]
MTFPEIPALRRSLTIPTSFGAAKSTVYYPPAESTGVPPVHVNFHGGGFVIGHPEQDDPLCRYLAARTPVAVLNVDYLLAPQHPFPTAPRQAWEVVRWVAEHGEGNGWDASRITVGGQSAGGSLAAAVARQARNVGTPALGLQILHYPALDAATSSWAKRSPVPRPVIRPWLREILIGAYVPRPDDRTHPLASPADDTNGDGLFGIAPAVVITCEEDLLRDEGIAYARKLRAADALVDHCDLHGTDHAYNIFGDDTTLAAHMYDLMADHLRRVHTGR